MKQFYLLFLNPVIMTVFKAGHATTKVLFHKNPCQVKLTQNLSYDIVWIPIEALVLLESIQDVHLGGGDREVQVHVLLEMLLRAGFRNDCDAVLVGPAKENLRRRLAQLLCDSCDGWIVSQGHVGRRSER